MSRYQPKCGDALWLGSKNRCGWFQLWIKTCGWQVKLDPSLTLAIPERFRDEFLMIKRYTNLRLLYFTLSVLREICYIIRGFDENVI